MVPLIFAMMRQPFQSLPVPAPGDFAGKTAIITGANSGIGLETARHLLSCGAVRVVLAVRNIGKGEQAREDLLRSAKVPNDARIDVWHLDMASFSSVKEFAAKITTASDVLHVDYLFLNAGLASSTFMKTSDGWERHLQVNTLANALLALLVLPTMSEQSRRRMAEAGPDAASKILLITSGLHTVTPFAERHSSNSFDTLNEESNFKAKSDVTDQYAITKLFDIYLAREIARLVPTDDSGHPTVIISSVDPGLTKTPIYNDGAPAYLFAFLYLFGRTAEVGSRNLTAAALMDSKSHGGFIHSAALDKPGKLVTSKHGEETQKKVWGEIVEVLEKVSPGIGDITSGKVLR